MDFRPLLPSVERKVRELGDDLRRTPGMLLNEADLQCALFKKFLEIEELATEYESADPGLMTTIPHAELSSFNIEGHLRIVPDITLIDPKGSISDCARGVAIVSAKC